MSIKFHNIVLSKYYEYPRMATAKSMKYLFQKNNDKLSIVLPRDLKNQVKKRAKRDGINPSQFVKLAMMEKLEREEL